MGCLRAVLTHIPRSKIPGGRHASHAPKTATVDGQEVFYREAGPTEAPVVLLLHGFPSSSHMVFE
jgi:hypothetical protein